MTAEKRPAEFAFTWTLGAREEVFVHVPQYGGPHGREFIGKSTMVYDPEKHFPMDAEEERKITDALEAQS